MKTPVSDKIKKTRAYQWKAKVIYRFERQLAKLMRLSFNLTAELSEIYNDTKMNKLQEQVNNNNNLYFVPRKVFRIDIYMQRELGQAEKILQ